MQTIPGHSVDPVATISGRNAAKRQRARLFYVDTWAKPSSDPDAKCEQCKVGATLVTGKVREYHDGLFHAPCRRFHRNRS